MTSVLVCGAGGFIGAHLVRRLKAEGAFVRGVDLVHPEFRPSAADEFIIGDLRDPVVAASVIDRRFDEIYQLAADMGGAGFIFTGDNGAALPHGKGSLYDPGVNVPLIIRWPGVVKAAGESSVLVSGEDIAPTLLEAAGLKPHPRMTGASFLPLLKGEPDRGIDDE